MKRLILMVASAVPIGAVWQPAGAPTFPSRAVRLVVPFSAGGPADTLARILADKLNGFWGQSGLVENRGGGGANIGTEFVARATADGHTLLLNASNHVINA